MTALDDDEVRSRLEALDSAWTVADGGLHRDLTFDDFRVAFAFMSAVALEAERLDHHPDWSNSWNRVAIDIVSHAAGGITDACFTLASRIDAHAARLATQPD